MSCTQQKQQSNKPQKLSWNGAYPRLKTSLFRSIILWYCVQFYHNGTRSKLWVKIFLLHTSWSLLACHWLHNGKPDTPCLAHSTHPPSSAALHCYAPLPPCFKPLSAHPIDSFGKQWEFQAVRHWVDSSWFEDWNSDLIFSTWGLVWVWAMLAGG